MIFDPPPWQPVHLTRDGTRLAHIEAGPLTPQALPLLLINGWTGDHGVFTPQIAHFARSRRVVAVNLRGHGASDAPEGDYTMEGFADDIAWQCRTLDLAKPVVIGHSLGGAVALELCGRHPDLAAGVVMIDTIVLPSHDAADSAEIEGLLAGVGSPDYQTVVQDMAWAIGCDYDHPARRQALFDTFIRGPAERTPQHVAYAALRSMVQDHDPVPAARACRIPMAYISADVPLVEQARNLDRLRELCPQLVTAKTLLAGHFNTIEVADQVNAMIERFLAVGLKAGG
ncbi:alpha/beta fold hydrolase [Methylobacterium bullatum]|uniref:Aminoacrylate hydrolase RutD n=1 Tax=Methylobacterium bullatum TaxID=570505 RepID=A0AAV4ZB22_9HYPH|nr:alpha/beta hydrolase [Methylobacterium bullatum]MBD8900694.1 alpha/beta hydrolase [Methylobacterium bullatum]GJD40798.1 Putative aminoacrylate hydrolase RutD [Methylobacterium bullatum]